ncbi:MAG: molybdenum cofactor guanylyltransferase [Novosphingobium sp.]|uniref:molybdenum cofactor guanylyltransferase n=1 Tax=Tsuneonella sp. CC-YZS046 TaxID=3042152 RepID=UPI002D7851C4|nr:molybdenum cofactor guanylyltransferase [Tsuneonella sp. CC-YZS046]WRO65532.1 molybdenum cofactor guanylyltransferase [Tsuneonella sp. CC-YZS046]
MILGLVLAGGRSSRFGSDKALAELNGQTLISRAIENLSGWCEQVIIAGRETGPAPCIPDWPRPGMGPLAGLAAGLHHARDAGFEAVLSCGVDSVDLPEDLPLLLDPAPACVASQPIIGLWPTGAAPVLERILSGNGKHSLHVFAQSIGARCVELAQPPGNVNTPADLAAIGQRKD